MKKRIQNLDLTNKKVIVRCDLNVTIKQNVIIDDTKIKASVETIKYILDHKGAVIIMSHLSKVETENDKKRTSLRLVCARLSELLNKEIIFVSSTRSNELTAKCKNLQPSEILMLENTRWEDVPKKLESNCNEELSKYWASLGDIFVNDAFGSSHRSHASVCGIPKYIPSAIGFLVQKEIENLDKVTKDPARPFTVIMGGAKVGDKFNLIQSIIKKCDYLLLGGGIANTFLSIYGYNVGASLVTRELTNELNEFLISQRDKIIMPIDVVVQNEVNEKEIKTCGVNEVKTDQIIFDIGEQTIKKYREYINKSRTILINGTVGKYEDSRYEKGTKNLLKVLSESDAKVIVAGGDALAAANKYKYNKSFEHISTGGGASLEYIIDGTLPGIEIIGNE